MRTRLAIAVAVASVIVFVQLRELSMEHAEYLESTYGIASPAAADAQSLATSSPRERIAREH